MAERRLERPSDSDKLGGGRRDPTGELYVADGLNPAEQNALAGDEVAVFLAGRFRYGCPVHGRMPKSNAAYGLRKSVGTSRWMWQYGADLRLWDGLSSEFGSTRMRSKLLPLSQPLSLAGLLHDLLGTGQAAAKLLVALAGEPLKALCLR